MPRSFFLLSPATSAAIGVFLIWLGWTMRRPVVTRRSGRHAAPRFTFIAGTVFLVFGSASLIGAILQLLQAAVQDQP